MPKKSKRAKRRQRTKRPERIVCEISGESLDMIATLLPAVDGWARANGAPPMSPADVDEFCIRHAYGQIMATASDLADEQEAERPARPLRAVH